MAAFPDSNECDSMLKAVHFTGWTEDFVQERALKEGIHAFRAYVAEEDAKTGMHRLPPEKLAMLHRVLGNMEDAETAKMRAADDAKHSEQQALMARSVAAAEQAAAAAEKQAEEAKATRKLAWIALIISFASVVVAVLGWKYGK